MRYINLRFTYLLTCYLLILSFYEYQLRDLNSKCV